MTSVGLYLHIPFCQAKCAYCSFNSYANMQSLHARYVEALCAEIRRFAETHEDGPVTADTIYIGGGTPTVLSVDQLSQLLAACRYWLDVSEEAEVSIEANPGTVRRDTLRVLFEHGVNRLSFGAQSFSSADLALLGRIHKVDDIEEAVRNARDAGFDNVNLDLIYGLPGQTSTEAMHNLQRALSLEPDHLSLYALSIEEGTPLATRIAGGDVLAPDDDAAADMYQDAERLLEECGYVHYELSNWARVRKRACDVRMQSCRHNLKYWQLQPYIGFGAGAHSLWRGSRSHNVMQPEQYCALLEQGLGPVAATAVVEPRERMAENMLLGLRLVEGIRLSDFHRLHGRDLRAEYCAELAELCDARLLVVDEKHVCLTPRGRLLANQVFLRFWPVAPESSG